MREAAGRIGILAGGGIRQENVARLIAATGVREVHARAAFTEPSPAQHHNPEVDFGGGAVPTDRVRVGTDAAHLARIVRLASDGGGGGDQDKAGSRRG